MTRVDRLFTILDETLHVIDRPHAVTLPPLSQKIEVRNLFFSYRNDEQWALKNISVTVDAGTTVALVGRSGSGKTTFINLLLRSYDPQRGAIFVDGVDIRDATQTSLREQIAVVPQEVDLFSRTIAENIGYGKKNVTLESIENAAKTALAHDFIMNMDQRYDTVVGGVESNFLAVNVSVSVCACTSSWSKILILDEATSHLDTESERLITKATDVLIKNRTSFIIAHRLSTVIHADMILVFNNGAIEAVEPTFRASADVQRARLHALQFADENKCMPVPMFSIILPTYNRAWIFKTLGFICRAIISRLGVGCSRRWINWWDKTNCQNGSSSWSTRKIYFSKKCATSGARKNGLEHALGEWVTYVDNDEEFIHII